MEIIVQIPKSRCQYLPIDDSRDECIPVPPAPAVCTSGLPSTVPPFSCVCTIDNHPTGCSCPQNSTSLIGVPKEQCKCLMFGDQRPDCIPEPKSDCIVSSSVTVPVGSETTPDCAHPTTRTSTTICPCIADEQPLQRLIAVPSAGQLPFQVRDVRRLMTQWKYDQHSSGQHKALGDLIMDSKTKNEDDIR
ncbi:MAG: hypothetical protein EZS28_049375 [Streblomastix strix]|uniref:Uncharacterized protein n=1 Tax=Streblomastix strix TaxID=222440 RepID=A0A5J4TA10_9EUKA|nr:MAG: hypothetical protein EZS28_049375 [Streblomastix strix]